MKAKKTKKTAKTSTKRPAKKKPTAKAKASSKTKAKAKVKSKLDYTHIIAVLDKSSSMHSVANAAMKGFNEFLTSQKALKGKATMDVLLFSSADKIDYISQGVDISEVAELTSETYRPQGTTALFDAIVKATSTYKLKYDELKPSKRPDKILVIAITDGEENSSTEFPISKVGDVKALITKRKSENWQFMFLCSTEDAVLTGESLGVSRGNTMQFTNSDLGNQAMYSAVASAATMYRSTSLRSKSFSKVSDNLLAEDDIS